jgi:membrane protease YdiL (CAAX protease family)
MLRLANSTILVAIFEELFIRAYLMQWLFQAGQIVKEKGFVNAILDTFDEKPGTLTSLPFSSFSLVLVTILFTAGHTTSEWVSAILWFSFTNYVYKKTVCQWVCILIHGMTNFAIGMLVKFGGMAWLW